MRILRGDNHFVGHPRWYWPFSRPAWWVKEFRCARRTYLEVRDLPVRAGLPDGSVLYSAEAEAYLASLRDG